MDDNNEAPAGEERKSKGTSIIIELTDEEAANLKAAIEHGLLKEFGVVGFTTLPQDEARRWVKSEQEKRRSTNDTTPPIKPQ